MTKLLTCRKNALSNRQNVYDVTTGTVMRLRLERQQMLISKQTLTYPKIFLLIFFLDNAFISYFLGTLYITIEQKMNL